MGSFLDLNLNDVKELKALEDGEYELRLNDAELRTVNNPSSAYNGAQFILLKFEAPDQADSKTITHTLFLPREQDDDKERNNRLRGIKAFCDAFDIDYQKGIDLEELKTSGAMGWALLKVEEDEEYGEQNRIRRFVVGQ